jgi:hypothetical protein
MRRLTLNPTSRDRRGQPVTIETLERRTLLSTVAYWRFEGIPGSAAATVADSSGNGLTGSSVNSPLYNSSVPLAKVPQTGAADKASLGLNGINQRIFIPDYPKLALTASITIEAWIYVAAPPGGPNDAGQILFRGDDRLGLDPYSLTLIDSSLTFQVTNAANGSVSVSAPLPGMKQWVFVAGELDGASGAMRLYVNGKLGGFTTTSIRPFAPLDAGSRAGLGIGNTQSANYAQYFPGFIDEVRVSNTALSPSQFLNAATSSISGTVFGDANANGKLDAGEKGLGGANVYIDANENGHLDSNETKVVTDATGQFKFASLAPGTYRLREVVPAGKKLTAPATGYFDVTLSTGKPAGGYSFADAPATARISGRLFGDTNADGIVNNHELGLGGWTVYLDLNNDGKSDGDDISVVTDLNGNWLFTGLLAGTYTVRVLPVAGAIATKPTGGVATIKIATGQASAGTLLGERAIV